MSANRSSAGSIVARSSRHARPGGLICYRDRGKRTHFGLARRAGVLHLSADGLADFLMRQRVLRLDQPGCVLLALILDGIVVADCLARGWQALSTLYRSADGVCLDWRDRDGRLQRRLLGPVSVLAVAACKRRGAFEAAATQLIEALQAAGFAVADIAALLSMVCTRLATALPGDLLAHVIHETPLSAVPRTCLARMTTQQALASRASKTPPQAATAERIRGRVADAIFAGADAGVPSDAEALLAAIRDACRADAGQPNAALDRGRMMRNLEALAPRCIAAGGWICLLWSWAADLVGRGTNRTQPLSPHSVDPYVMLTIGKLYRSVGELPLERVETIDWLSLYDALEQSPSILPTQRGKAAAALTAWHEYLVEHLGVAPLERPIDAEGAVMLPQANIVWPHEQAWIRGQLALRTDRSRFDAQLATVAELAFAAALRSQDLWHIHMYCVELGTDTAVVRFDPLPSAGRGKSKNARRSVEFGAGPAPARLSDWLERRRAEGALATDLLFGDPADPRTPFRRGATEAALNAWLKAATGDSTASLHTLRHSYLSLARAAADGCDQREMNEISAQAGHGSTSTSLEHYCHCYERILRSSMDRWLRTRPLTEATVCALIGMPAGCLRQRWHRYPGIDRLTLDWAAIDAAAAGIDLSAASAGIAMTGPVPLPLQATPAISAGRVLTWLQELCAAVPEDVTMLRHDITGEQWEAFKMTIACWWRCLGRRARSVVLTPPARPAVPFAAGFGHMGQPKLAPMVRALRSVTDRAALVPAVQSWLDTLCEPYLAFDDASRMLPLLRWLHACGVAGTQIVVCHDRGQIAAADDAATVVEIVFGAAPMRRPEQPRAGRPQVYLMLRADEEPSCGGANAATSVAGLNALLFSAWVWLQMLAREHAHG